MVTSSTSKKTDLRVIQALLLLPWSRVTPQNKLAALIQILQRCYLVLENFSYVMLTAPESESQKTKTELIRGTNRKKSDNVINTPTTGPAEGYSY